MSPNQRDRRRDLSKNWCPEGEPFSSAAGRLSQSRRDALHEQFVDAGRTEYRASVLLLVFTALDPTNADPQVAGSPSQNGAVDIVLTPPSAPPEIVEVTSSFDTDYESSSAKVRRFEEKILHTYAGGSSWNLDINGDWHQVKLMALAPEVAQTLTDLDRAETKSGTLTLSDSAHMVATRCETIGAPTVHTWSKHAGVIDSEEPYLQALGSYLATNGTVQRKLRKLERERALHGASRIHLFVLMASTGTHGRSFPQARPTSPRAPSWHPPR